MNFYLNDTCFLIRIGFLSFFTSNTITLYNGDIFYGFSSFCFGEKCLTLASDFDNSSVIVD
jgi:hypothetical protein